MKQYFLSTLSLLLLLSMSFSHSAVQSVVKKPYQQTRYSMQNKAIVESSGLACSTRDKHLLWTHNDSGHMPIIYVLSDTGEDLGSWFLDGVESIDWEDMDAFEYQGRHYLLVADSGDNFRMLWEHRISIIEEPLPSAESRSTLTPAWTVRYQFEDGLSYDVEAVAVDTLRDKIVLLSKRHKPTLMFELALKPASPEQLQTAVKTGELPQIVHPSALDFSSDGRIMSINTYRRIHRFVRVRDKSTGRYKWRYQYSLKYNKMHQPEAMCLSRNNKNYYITSEKSLDLLKVRVTD